jgi:dimethylargininase
MLIALTREISPAIARCELTHREREAIVVDLARAQHAAYEACLRDAGCRVERLAAGPDMPDSVFIEDTAIVFDEVAIITRPGAASRRAETAGVADALQKYRPLHRIEAPGTADGGDVLVVGRHVFVGRSSRTNEAGIDQMRRVLTPYNYEVITIDVRGCLHMKSAATAVGDDLLLINPAWLPSWPSLSTGPFASFDRIDVHPDEPSAANALRIGDQIIYPTSFPRTRERLERRGLRIAAVEASEVAKAEGAVTCCSLILGLKSLEPEP